MTNEARSTLIVAALSGLLAVALGAFGAHALDDRIGPDRLDTFKTANLYHFLHTLALLAVGIVAPHLETRLARTSRWCFGIGVVLFSGSLYLLAVSGLSKLGIVAPIGGVLLMIGWASFAAALYRGVSAPD